VRKKLQSSDRKLTTSSFLLPSLQMRLLLEQTTPGEIKYVLRQLPRTCDEFYRDTLEGIMGLSDSQHRLAKKTFTWLFESFRPLRVEELRHAIAIQEVSRVLEEQQVPSTKTIEFVCKGLVTVDRSYERIALLHPTLQMYLKMNRDSFFPNAKRIVARCCTTYLLFDDLNSGPCVSKNDLEERLHKYPLLPYLCRYWGYHCRDYWRDEVKDSAMRILRDSVLLDSIAQVYHITKNQLRFLDNFKPSPRDLNGLHVVGLFGLIDAAKEIILSEPSLIYSTDSWGRTPLHVAADNGQYAIAELLLANHASVEAKNRHGKTPLHMAAANGHQRIVDLLLKKNADILVKDEDKNTALDLAAGSGEVDVVKRFLEAGIDHQVNGNTTPPTKSAIQKAATTGESQVLEVLLESGAEPDADTLKRAAASGVQETVSLLLECGVSPNSRGSEMKTALHSAAAAGHSGVVRQPIESGADLSISDDQDKTPFFMAVSQGDERMVRRLLEGGADIESQTATGETALLHAAAAGRLPIVKLLLSYGADVNTARSHPKDLQRRETDSPCEQYDNSLQAAAGEGHDKIVHELLLNGADIEITDRKGSRPIHAAAEQNNTAVVKVLLDASCVPDPADVEGRRPIHLAARGGFVETVELLSNSCEVDRNVMDNLKRTPLSYACESASEGVVQVLLSAGVSADEKDEQGRTPLSYAAEAGNESIVLALLRKGVKADTKDNTGHDPLYYASLKKHAAVVKLLRST
jgi:ankyrin repeat protein